MKIGLLIFFFLFPYLFGSYSVNDLYSMSEKELSDVPPSLLMQEIDKLTQKRDNQKKQLNQVQTLNFALCRRWVQLEEECLVQTRIAKDEVGTPLKCSDSGLNNLSNPEIVVKLANYEGLHFRLVAEKDYVSQIFSGPRSEPLVFSRDDGKVVRPPRLMDLTSLYLVTVNLTSQRVRGSITDQIPRPKDLKVGIEVNGQNLLKLNAWNPHEDPLLVSIYQAPLEEVLAFSKDSKCLITDEELMSMEKASKE